MDPKIAIACPSFPMVHATFAVSLAAMLHGIEVPVAIINVKSSNIALSRNRSVQEAQKIGADWILWIDTDLSFPPDSLLKLLDSAIEKNLDIVGCNYLSKSHPHKSLAKGLIGSDPVACGLTEVERLPGGFMLTRMSVFDRLAKPWFQMPVFGEEVGGEDYFFCDSARAAGYKIWMDTDLSLMLAHWGEVGYRWSDTDSGYVTVSADNF